MNKFIITIVFSLFAVMSSFAQEKDESKILVEINCVSKIELEKQLKELGTVYIKSQMRSIRTIDTPNGPRLGNATATLFTNNKGRWILVEEVKRDKFCGLAYGDAFVSNKL